MSASKRRAVDLRLEGTPAERVAQVRATLDLGEHISALYRRRDGDFILDHEGRPVFETYLVQVSMPDGKQEQKRSRKLRDAQRQRDALHAKRDKWKKEIELGLRDRTGTARPPVGSKTVSETVALYLKRTVLPQTITRDQSVLRVHVEPALGTRTLGSVDWATVETLIQQMPLDHLDANGERLRDAAGHLRRKVTACGIHNVVKRLTIMFTWAIKTGLMLGPNPAEGHKLPHYVPRKRRVLDEDESLALEEAARALIAAAPSSRLGYLPEWLYALIVLLGQTGCRIGMALALRWDYVDLDKAEIYWRATVVHQPCLRIQEFLKNRSPDSPGYPQTVSRGVCEALRKLKTVQATFAETADGWEGAEAEHGGLVFPTLRGGLMWPATARATVMQLISDAGSALELVRDFRGTFITQELEAGVSDIALADSVGHKEVGSLEPYKLLLRRLRTATADAMDDIRRKAVEKKAGGPSGPPAAVAAFLEVVRLTARGAAEGPIVTGLDALIAAADILMPVVRAYANELPLDAPTHGEIDLAVGALLRLRGDHRPELGVAV